MTVYLLYESSEYDKCYFVDEFSTREQALNALDYSYMHKFRFIEGQELKLQLTEKENNNGQI